MTNPKNLHNRVWNSLQSLMGAVRISGKGVHLALLLLLFGDHGVFFYFVLSSRANTVKHRLE